MPWAAPYSNAAPTSHAPISPFNPVNFYSPVDLFGPPNISDFGDGPKRKIGFFFSYERVFWSLSKPSTSTIGSEEAEQTVTLGGVPNTVLENTIDTSFIQSHGTYGNRFELGYMDTNNKGWLVGIIDHVSQNFSRDLIGGNYILFNDPVAALDGFVDRDGDGIFDDLTTFLPLFDEVVVSNHAELNGVEVMRMYRAPRGHNGGNLELYVGARYVKFDDRFTAYAFGNILADSFWQNKVENSIVGPQIAGRYSHQRGRWTFSAEGRLMAGANFESAHFSNHIATLAPPVGGTGIPANLAPSSALSANYTTTFAPVGELRVQTSYQLTSAAAIRFGYTGMYIGGLTRASNTIDYTLLKMGIIDGNHDQDLFVNGISLGIEFNR